MFDMELLLAEVIKNPMISDLHLTVNSPPIVRINGDLQILDGYFDYKLCTEEINNIIVFLMDNKQLEIFQNRGEYDFSYASNSGARFRVNVYRQRGKVSLALRIIPGKILSIDELHLPSIVKDLTSLKNGLVLCTGPTGSGKTTTLAAMLDLINSTRTCHIVTLEDPIEFLHPDKKSLIHQREVGIDTLSFASGLRAALRQDPDVILVGEMRDLDTISIALEAAETGHLVFATLHTRDACGTIERIVDVFPPEQQQQIRVQLAGVLQGVIAQQLVKRVDKPGRTAALEVMVVTPAVRNLIRENKSHQIYSLMQTGAKIGMQTMDAHLARLYREGIISYEEGLSKAISAEFFGKLTQNPSLYGDRNYPRGI